VILDPHPTPPFDIHARLDRHHHPRRQRRVAAGREAAAVVDAAAQPVAEPVAELLAEAAVLDHLPRRRVCVLAGHARSDPAPPLPASDTTGCARTSDPRSPRPHGCGSAPPYPSPSAAPRPPPPPAPTRSPAAFRATSRAPPPSCGPLRTPAAGFPAPSTAP